MRHKAKRSAQSAHVTLASSQTLTPPQPLWQGPPPSCVETILTRSDALSDLFRDFYADWASNFAILKSDYLRSVQIRETTRIGARFPQHKWEYYKWWDLLCSD